MKRNLLYIFAMLVGFSLLGASCSKHDDDIPDNPNPPVVDPDKPDDPTYPTFDAPAWNVTSESSFEHTMTFTLVLPDSLKANEQSVDCMAVFSNNECRGVANRIEVSSGNYVWIAMAYGNTESEALSIKYYSSKTKYMYCSESTIPFAIDGNIGNIDNPQTIGMKIVTSK